MAAYAKPGIDSFDVRAQIAKWSLRVQTGDDEGFLPALDSIYSVMSHAMQEIFNLAEGGNENAAKKLYNIFAAYVPQFDELCHMHPEIFEPLARKTTHWPAEISRHSDTKKRNAKLIALLNLGANSGLNLDGKQWSINTPEVKAALRCYGLVKLYREDYLPENIKRFKAQIRQVNKRLGRPSNYRPPLPKPLPKLPSEMQSKLDRENELTKESRQLSKSLNPLNRQNYSEWFRASWPIFLMRYGNDFENRKCFSHYWKSDAFMESDPAQPGKKRLMKRARGDIRDAIKNQFKQAFRSIAPKSSRVR
jgi:hypothetical protein